MTYAGTALAQQQPAPRIEWHELPTEIQQHTAQHLYHSARIDQDTAVVYLRAIYGDEERLTYRLENGHWALRAVFTERNMGR